MKEKQAVTREYAPHYQQAAKKEKQTLLDEFTWLTGYHRKSAVRLLRARPVKQVMLYLGGDAVKLKPEKMAHKPHREAPLYRQGHRRLAGLSPHRGHSGKTQTDKSRSIDQYLKKDKDALRLKGKSLIKLLCSLKSRIPGPFTPVKSEKGPVSGKSTRTDFI
jgi:hypothetical protein